VQRNTEVKQSHCYVTMAPSLTNKSLYHATVHRKWCFRPQWVWRDHSSSTIYLLFTIFTAIFTMFAVELWCLLYFLLWVYVY